MNSGHIWYIQRGPVFQLHLHPSKAMLCKGIPNADICLCLSTTLSRPSLSGVLPQRLYAERGIVSTRNGRNRAFRVSKKKKTRFRTHRDLQELAERFPCIGLW